LFLTPEVYIEKLYKDILRYIHIMATTTTIVRRSEFGEMDKVGGLMCPSDYYDARHYCDLKKIRKANPELVGKRIFKILTMTDNHPDFANVVNDKITYKKPMFCDEAHPMKRKICGETNPIFVCYHPVGNVIILVCG
jgi:hypothetical protein